MPCCHRPLRALPAVVWTAGRQPLRGAARVATHVWLKPGRAAGAAFARFIKTLEVTAVGLPFAVWHVCRRVCYTGTLRCTALLPGNGDDRYITGPVWFPPSQFTGLGPDGTGASRPAGLGSVREELLAHCKSGARACTSAMQPWAALSMRHWSSCSASPHRALSACASTVSFRVRSATGATARHLPPLPARGAGEYSRGHEKGKHHSDGAGHTVPHTRVFATPMAAPGLGHSHACRGANMRAAM